MLSKIVRPHLNKKILISFSTKQFSSNRYIPDKFADFIPADNDIGNTIASLANPSDFVPLDLMSKMSSISISNSLYAISDFFTDFLVYLENGHSLSMGTGIIIVTLLIKLGFAPFNILMLLNATKLKLLDPEMQNFNELNKTLTRKHDFEGSKQARMQMQELRERYNIKMSYGLVLLLQFPFIISWFISLRYMATLPEKYPELINGGFLWFTNLTAPDPYCCMPLLSAFASYFNIAGNPNLSTSGQTYLTRYSKYLKFMPFVGIPFVAFFPSALTLYWAIMAFSQLIITWIARSDWARKISGIPEYLPGSILEKINQKTKANIIKTDILQNAKEIISEKIQGNPEVKERFLKMEDVVNKPDLKVQVFTNKPKKSKQ